MYQCNNSCNNRVVSEIVTTTAKKITRYIKLLFLIFYLTLNKWFARPNLQYVIREHKQKPKVVVGRYVWGLLGE